MQLGNVINIGLGLAFTFFLMSLITSAIQEFVAGIFRWRGTYLAKALDVILSNNADATFKWYGLQDWLTAHLTSAAGMSEAQHQLKLLQPPKLWFRPPPPPAPPPVLTEAEQRLAKLLAAIKSHPLIKNTPTDLPSYISGKTFAMALLSALRDGSDNSLFLQVKSNIEGLPPGDLKNTLSTFLADAGRDLDKFRANIETWFDGAMDRLSGIYKRIAQYGLLIIGFILAVALNVNALHLAAVLWTMDPASLAALADIAAQVKTPQAQQSLSDIGASLHQLQGLGLPIGWPQPPDWGAVLKPEFWRLAHIQHILGRHLAGWLVTMAAVSFGAPFWFDLIQKLVPLRNTGPKPDGNAATT